MRLLLAAVFVSVVLGLFWKDYGPRQRAVITALAMSVTALYYFLASRLM